MASTPSAVNPVTPADPNSPRNSGGPGGPESAGSPTSPKIAGSPPANPAAPGANPGEGSAAQGYTLIDIDDGFSDSEGLYESSYGTDTTSLSSGIFEYQYENGRRYHAYREGRYVMPNDEKEQDRLDMTHHMYLILLDGHLVVAPIESPQMILDVGTGTGIWAIDVADQFPSAVVTGTDLSPIQPSWVPPNCKFQVDDAESDWSFARDSFDLVHSRHLMTSIRNWPKYMKQIYESLKPGGWVQMLEHDFVLSSDDDSLAPDSQLRRYFDLYNTATEKIGLPSKTHKLSEMLQETGFTEVTQTIYRLPWGPWAKDKKLKEIGAWMLANAESSFEAYGLAFLTRVLGKSPEEAKELCDRARGDLKSKKVHVYNNHYVIIGRKPLET